MWSIQLDCILYISAHLKSQPVFEGFVSSHVVKAKSQLSQFNFSTAHRRNKAVGFVCVLIVLHCFSSRPRLTLKKFQAIWLTGWLFGLRMKWDASLIVVVSFVLLDWEATLKCSVSAASIAFHVSPIHDSPCHFLHASCRINMRWLKLT